MHNSERDLNIINPPGECRGISRTRERVIEIERKREAGERDRERESIIYYALEDKVLPSSARNRISSVHKNTRK